SAPAPCSRRAPPKTPRRPRRPKTRPGKTSPRLLFGRLPVDQSLGDLVLAHFATAQSRNDGPGKLAGDLADTGQGAGLGLSNAGFRVGQLGGDLGFDRAALFFHFRRQRFAHAFDDRLRLAPRLAQGALVVAQRLRGFYLDLLRLPQVALDTLTPLLNHLADARQIEALEQQIEQAEAQSQPDELRGKGARIQWREHLGMSRLVRGRRAGCAVGRHRRLSWQLLGPR